jgi:hypothetical protein
MHDNAHQIANHSSAVMPFDLPSGPAVILVAGLDYVASVLFGPRDSPRAVYLRRAF